MPFAYKIIASIIAALALIGAVWAHFAGDARTRDKLEALTEQAGQVLLATRQASGNDSLTWSNAAGQIVALGESNKALKGEIAATNLRIDELARQAVAAKAHAAEMVKIADKARAQRSAALRKLSDMAATPATRDDCMTLLREAETALDLVHGAMQ